jgi:hypothetical protein
MKRTTIYLEPELEVLLKLEMLRQGRSMAEIVREAVHAYVTRAPQKAPPGAGVFRSGRSDTASQVDDALKETGFGGVRAAGRPAARARRKTSR